MNVNSTNVVASQNQYGQKTTEQPNNELGKDAFLKILVTQMKNQDPLEPLKDTEFIGQMAQFSSLEQLTNLNQAMNALVGLQVNQAITNYADLIGKKINWEQAIDGKLESGEGIVKALSYKNSELVIELDDGTSIPLTSITRIESLVENEN